MKCWLRAFLVALIVAMTIPGVSHARKVVNSTADTFAWQLNYVTMSAIADDGTMWGLIHPIGADASWTYDPVFVLNAPSWFSWVQLPSLPDGKVPAAMLPVDGYFQLWTWAYVMCLDTDGTVWILTPKILYPEPTFACISPICEFSPEWHRYTPQLPQPAEPIDAAADLYTDAGVDLVCD